MNYENKLALLKEWKHIVLRVDATIDKWLDLGLSLESSVIQDTFAMMDSYESLLATLLTDNINDNEWVEDLLFLFKTDMEFGEKALVLPTKDNSWFVYDIDSFLRYVEICIKDKQ